MTEQKRYRVAVIYGGQSFEHEVSMLSARGVMQNMDKTLFEVLPVRIAQDGDWIWGDESVCQLEAPYQNLPKLSSGEHTFAENVPQLIASHATRKDLVQSVASDVDIVFPLIHGVKGEDGTLQGLLEMANLPYVGSGVLSSAICMDKHLTKQLVAAAGVPVVPYQVVKKYEWLHHTDQIMARAQSLGELLFVKPANSGSSVGINKVTNATQLKAAIDEAFLYDHKILIEKGIAGREIELSVLEHETYGEDPRVSIAGEIVPRHGFYSYEAKYIDPDGAALLIPAELHPEQLTQLQQFSKQAFLALECAGMARADFFIDKDTSEYYFNEMNTLPGFTPISMYPKLWEASGLPYSALITQLLHLALTRHTRSEQLHHEVAKGETLIKALGKK